MHHVNFVCSTYNNPNVKKATRGGSRTTTTSKMELFVTIVNGFQPLTVTIKCSILDVAAVLDPPLKTRISEKSVKATLQNQQLEKPLDNGKLNLTNF